jgi:hypothetical protein
MRLQVQFFYSHNNKLEVVLIMRHVSAFCIVLLLQGLPRIAQAQAPQIQPASDPIEQVVTAGLMSNLPDGQFHPESFINRAELASILVKAFRLDKRAAANQENLIEVKDVPNNNPAFNDIQTVLKTGIMKGYRDNMFFPNQKVTRAEAFAIFAQAYGVFQFPDNTIEAILANYPDVASIPSWARKSLATALNEGFVNTDAQNKINPLQPMTRGDMAYALSRYLERQQAR